MIFILKSTNTEIDNKTAIDTLLERALDWNLVLYNVEKQFLVCDVISETLSN